MTLSDLFGDRGLSITFM